MANRCLEASRIDYLGTLKKPAFRKVRIKFHWFPINKVPCESNHDIGEKKSTIIAASITLIRDQREMSINRRSNILDPFSIDLGDPLEGFHFGSNSLSHPRSSISGEISAFADARFDWKETPEAHVFKADLPGLKKEEVKVEVEEEGRVLRISGERKREKEEKSDTWHRIERSSGNFLRHFRLPENAKVDGVKAAMENGVLTVTVPKEEVKKVNVKSIEISG
ncbi:hypothetical protein IEQ34_023005 [Dendrobium chrysotoxum]|uniref:SHSP domain-containing protein n=1 Tax=Dendrobium chrysotoxum TaxID=161865 RepID=A0AAV7FKB7_DENCH|nr:hypothetical protein IEQ34_023005 [Dendrobium chrysotoxum]